MIDVQKQIDYWMKGADDDMLTSNILILFKFNKRVTTMAKEEVIKTLKKFIALLKDEGFSIEKAFLYGSYSFDTSNENSDIDLMIVTNNVDANDDLLVGKVWKLTRRINTKIEPFLVGIDKFNQSDNSPLIDLVKKTGIKIT